MANFVTKKDGSKVPFDQEKIKERLAQISEAWKTKYANMRFKPENLKFDSMMNFNHSFTSEIEFLNLETK